MFDKPSPLKWYGPLLIAAVTLIMLDWSWQTWSDPLVDFGAQLYTAWQMTLGKVIYRDFTYYSGPFSQYLNAGMLMLLGVSVRTLVIENLIVLGGILILIYRLALRASGPVAAVTGCLTFVLIFAFGQNVGIGNYNWVTPYRNEVTHGIALGLLAVMFLDRRSDHRSRRLLAAGIATGLALLTKIEPATGTLAATAAMLAAGWWSRRESISVIAKEVAIFLGGLVSMPLLAVALMSLQMPLRVAVLGVAGSWRWVLDNRVTALPFYRSIAGTDDIFGNLSTIAEWTLLYAVLVGAAVALAFLLKSKRRSAAVLVFFIAALGMVIVWETVIVDWNQIIRPLPICLPVILIVAGLPIAGRRRVEDRSLLRFGLVVFAMAMLAKISLNAHVFHYGFALSMPGVLVLVAVVGNELPALITRRGGNGDVIRAISAVCWGMVIFVTLYLDHLFFAQKIATLGDGPDAMQVNARGVEVKNIVDQIRQHTPANSTLVVLPQGLMVNYLARRVDPIPNSNFMPPEVIAEGEDNIIANLRAHPPDEILLNQSAIEHDAFTLDSKYNYGQKTLAWVRNNYDPAILTRPGDLYRFELLIRKPALPSRLGNRGGVSR